MPHLLFSGITKSRKRNSCNVVVTYLTWQGRKNWKELHIFYEFRQFFFFSLREGQPHSIITGERKKEKESGVGQTEINRRTNRHTATVRENRNLSSSVSFISLCHFPIWNVIYNNLQLSCHSFIILSTAQPSCQETIATDNLSLRSESLLQLSSLFQRMLHPSVILPDFHPVPSPVEIRSVIVFRTTGWHKSISKLLHYLYWNFKLCCIFLEEDVVVDSITEAILLESVIWQTVYKPIKACSRWGKCLMPLLLVNCLVEGKG